MCIYTYVQIEKNILKLQVKVKKIGNFFENSILLYLTHEIMRKSFPSASVNQHYALWVDVCSVHGRTFHSWVRESHLHVNIVDAL